MDFNMPDTLGGESQVVTEEILGELLRAFTISIVNALKGPENQNLENNNDLQLDEEFEIIQKEVLLEEKEYVMSTKKEMENSEKYFKSTWEIYQPEFSLPVENYCDDIWSFGDDRQLGEPIFEYIKEIFSDVGYTLPKEKVLKKYQARKKLIRRWVMFKKKKKIWQKQRKKGRIKSKDFFNRQF